MPIFVNGNTFHLQNASISYIFEIIDCGLPVHLYYGRRLHDAPSFSHLHPWHERACDVQICHTPRLSREFLRAEYPSALSGDMRMPALDIQAPDSSRVVDFRYDHYEIEEGAPDLDGLPHAYTTKQYPASTLRLYLKDPVLQAELCLLYTIYEDLPVILRSAMLTNTGTEAFRVKSLQSLSLDLPEADYEMISLTGAWARERNIQVQPLHQGLQSVYSLRGHSSHNFNPFLGLKRKECTEMLSECIGVSILYSGNWIGSVDVDPYHTARISMGMHPFTTDWKLEPAAQLQSPQAVLVYSDQGLNHMSQAFHTLFQNCVCRGPWKKKARPILLNNWEGTYFDFNEEKILAMAREAADLGIELFVLDDGWFKNRNDDHRALGDWTADRKKLPDGIAGLSKKIRALGLDFGLWIEPEMISEDSDLFRAHPEYALQIPGRERSRGRNQLVLDFASPEVVETIYQMLIQVLDGAEISYIKWDMNRSMSEVASSLWPQENTSVYHRYILGVYALYERLIKRYPEILFESCAGGGGRFDAGMLYYAPQAWTSDDTDAAERLKIQYGTSMLYPLSSMGSHVSAVPNHQLARITSLKMRGDVACFGTFGYELDPRELTDAEKAEIKEQIVFMKQYRELIQFGTFWRLASPFAGNNTAWMVVSEDQNTAIVGIYQVLSTVNERLLRFRLAGLKPDCRYGCDLLGYTACGDELMQAGLIVDEAHFKARGDFLSAIYILKAEK